MKVDHSVQEPVCRGTVMSALLRLTASFCLLAIAGGSAGAAAPVDPATVRQILILRCGECHGSQLPKPKGKFGHVGDLARLAADPEMVVPGEPDRSELYLLMVEEDPEFRMPPASSKGGELSALELATIRDWIAGGAGDGSSDPADAADPLTGADGESEADPGSSGADGGSDAAGVSDADTSGMDAGAEPPCEILMLLGRLHPAVVHMPIGLLAAAALAELLVMLFGVRSLVGTVRFCLWIGTLTSLVAAFFGWQAGEFHGYSGFDLDLHRWLGVATAGLAVLATIVNETGARRRDENRPRGLFRLLLFAAALTMGVGGHFGGVLVHGSPF